MQRSTLISGSFPVLEAKRSQDPDLPVHLLSPISFFTWSHSRYTLWKLVTKQSKSKARRSIIIATKGNILAYIHLILLDAFTISKHTTKQDGQLSMCSSHCLSMSRASTDTVCVSFKSSLRLRKGNFRLLPSAAISSPQLHRSWWCCVCRTQHVHRCIYTPRLPASLPLYIGSA